MAELMKLVIDEAAQNILIEKAPNQPLYSGPGGKLLSPGIIHVIEPNDTWNKWQPGDECTSLLVLGREACREILFQAERLAENSHQQQRAIKNITVPLCSLMDQINKLRQLLNNDRAKQTRSTWPRFDQENYKNIGRRFNKKCFNGPVRKVRNKLGAHLDQEAIGNSLYELSIEDLLLAFGDSLILFMLIVKHHNTFAWIRSIDSFEHEEQMYHIVETQFEYPVCVQWLTDNKGKVIDAGNFHLAVDPRQEIQDDVVETIGRFNEMVEHFNIQMPQIFLAPSDTIRKMEEGNTAI